MALAHGWRRKMSGLHTGPVIHASIKWISLELPLRLRFGRIPNLDFTRIASSLLGLFVDLIGFFAEDSHLPTTFRAAYNEGRGATAFQSARQGGEWLMGGLVLNANPGSCFCGVK